MRDVATLHDVSDTARCKGVISPEGVRLRQAWQRAAELLLATARNGADVEVVRIRLSLLCFFEARLVLFPENDAEPL
jgi:hypothetical protein